jgi:membrane-associated phospholipid phosphatase
MKTLSRFLSVLFHPLIMPTLGLLVIFLSGLNFTFFSFEQKRAILLIVFLSTSIIPLSFIPFFLLKKPGFRIEMDSARDRLLPFFLTSFIYFIAWFFLWKIGIPELLLHYVFASALAVLFTSIITGFWKISAHMVGIGGIAGLILYLSFYFNADVFLSAIFILFLAGIIGSARLTLKAHIPEQIYTGFLLGFVTVLLTLVILA